MYKEDLALNNLQWLICHKTQPNQIIYLIYMYKEDLALNNLLWLICHKNQTKLTDTTTPDQSGPGSNKCECALHTPRIFRTGASPSNEIYYHTQDNLITLF